MQFEYLLTKRDPITIKPSISYLLSQNSLLTEKLIDDGNLLEAVEKILEGAQLIKGKLKAWQHVSENVQKLSNQAFSLYEDQHQLIGFFQYVADTFKDTQFEKVVVDIYNYIACCYRKLQNFTAAYKYLSKSLISCTDKQQKAQTYLNMCSIQSQEGNHQQAKHSARYAINILKNMQTDYEDTSSEEKDIQPQTTQLLAASYYNLAVELEFLRDKQKAIKYYQRANDMLRNTSPHHPLAKKIHTAFQQMIEKDKSDRKTSSHYRSRSVQKQSPYYQFDLGQQHSNFSRQIGQNKISKQ